MTKPDATPHADEPQGWTPSRRDAGFLLAGLLLGLSTCFAGRDAGPPSAPGASAESPPAPTVWTCSMHPQIHSPQPGQCPICGMDLIPLEAGADDRAPRELRLSPAAAALAEIETQPVERRSVTREVRMVGKVDFDETRLDYITAWVSGRLDRMFVDYTGTMVREGDHLVEVYSPELLSAQEELLQAIAARRTLAGSSPLLQQTAAQTVASAREKLRLWGLAPDQIAAIESSGAPSDHVTIRAPLGGVVVHKNKNRGDYVKTGERIYTIADLSRVWVKLDAYESDLPWVRYGQPVEFETEAYPGVRFAGQVVFIDPVLAGDTRTIKVRLNVDNHDGRLKPGMFVRGVLRAPLEAEGRTLDPSLVGQWICPMHGDVIKPEAGSCDECGMALVPAESLHRPGETLREPPLVVPASAVLWTGRRSLVYVREPGDEPRYVGQEVVLGPRAGDDYVIREGLEAGQQVVTRGAFKIDSALQIEARPSMMLPPEGATSDERHAAPPAFLEALGPLFKAYLRVQDALASDDLAGASAAAGALREALGRVELTLLRGEAHVAWLGLAQRLRDAAAALARAGALDSARAAFHDLSEAALELERGFGHPAGTLREARCPMARDGQGASWIQAGDELRNPYYGAAMLRCGTFEADLPARLEPTGQPPAGPADPEPRAPDTTPVEPDAPSPPAHEDQGAVVPEDTGPPAAEQAAAFVRALDPVYTAYLSAQEALASDDLPATKAAGESLRAAVQGVDMTLVAGEAHRTWMGVARRLADAGGALAGADGIHAARVAFHHASQAALELERGFGHTDGVLREAFCPMARERQGASWLQRGDALRNPYFGARMLRCGEFKADFPARSEASSTATTPPAGEGSR